MKVKVVSSILEANQRIAAQNRRLFDDAKVFVINLMGAPGAGKTSVLVNTLNLIKNKAKIGVIEGDIAGTHDAELVRETGVPVVQINTNGACHLDANMINAVLNEDFPLKGLDFLIIENVGNLVCPAEFDVGEHMKVMVLSLTEGDDKPLKYPLMFRESRALIINKMDLLPHLDVDVEKIRHDAISINRELETFALSCKTQSGFDYWIKWLTGLK